MLAVVVGLEKGEPECQLEDDAPDAPDVAGLGPAQLQDDFRSPVVARGDDGAVMLVVKRGGTEVDQPDFRVLDEPHVLLLAGVVDDVVAGVEEEDVLRLQVGVGQSVVVHEFYGVAELVGHLPDLFQRVGFVVVVLEEVEDAGPQHLEGDAHVAVVIEPIEHLDAPVFAPGVVLGQLLQDVDLELGGLAVLAHVLDDLQGDDLGFVQVFDLDHLPEGPLAQGGHDPEAVLDQVTGGVDQVALVIVLDDGGRRRGGGRVGGGAGRRAGSMASVVRVMAVGAVTVGAPVHRRAGRRCLVILTAAAVGGDFVVGGGGDLVVVDPAPFVLLIISLLLPTATANTGRT